MGCYDLVTGHSLVSMALLRKDIDLQDQEIARFPCGMSTSVSADRMSGTHPLGEAKRETHLGTFSAFCIDYQRGLMQLGRGSMVAGWGSRPRRKRIQRPGIMVGGDLTEAVE